MTRLEVRDLRVELEGSGVDVVDGISFALEAGEILGLVGESGSGKTTIGVALLGHARRGARITGGQVLIDGEDVLVARGPALERLRGETVSYVAQDPAAALNPAVRLGRQLEETLVAHGMADAKRRRQRIVEVLEEVSLPSDAEFLKRYAHQISGGQAQRLAIAIAFACRPKVIVCDEPTTGLDVTTQARILATIRQLCSDHGVSAVYVSHDLGVVADLADQVVVLYAGRIAEAGARRDVFEHSAHPYTRRLMAAIPGLARRLVLEPIPGRAPSPGTRPDGCFFAPRCALAVPACIEAEPPTIAVAPGHVARCLRAEEVIATANVRSEAPSAPAVSGGPVLRVQDVQAFYRGRPVLHGVSLELAPRECLALVGESGSGKTTLSRVIIGLMKDRVGTVEFEGQILAADARERPVEVRRRLQYVFQSPYNSLNPRRTIGDTVGAPAAQFFDLDARETRARAVEALERVSLSERLLDRYPDQLSGGERQRAAIARALACEPSVLICDEITSALDVSVQASIVALLERLRSEEDLSLLFVTHNLPLVRSIADRVMVMNAGAIVEVGDCGAVFTEPRQDYTRKLVSDTPDPASLLPV